MAKLKIESHWHVGVDLGQSHDPTAVCVLETKTAHIPDMALPHELPHWRKQVREFQQPFHVRHLERLPLGMSYPNQVLHVAALLNRSPLNNARTFIDYTGVGRPVFDLFREARIPGVQGIAITAGSEVKKKHTGWSVPKNILVSRVQALLHTEQLKVAAGIPDAQILLRELQDFRVSYTSSGFAVFNARSGSHDDLVLAVALAVFGASQPKPLTRLDMKFAV